MKQYASAESLSVLFLLLVSLSSLIISPHSKVEESFNLQACHDLYYHGWTPALREFRVKLFVENDEAAEEDVLPYDHLNYPGVVPRTFLGPLVITSVVQSLSFILRPIYDLSSRPLLVQSVCRLVLLIFNVHAFWKLGGAADRHLSNLSHGMRNRRPNLVCAYFLLITTSQFHLPYYASRMLPNTFALIFVVHAYAFWFDRQPRCTATCLVFATAVFRCDVLILLFTAGLTMLIRKEMTIKEAILVGLMAVCVSLTCTIPIDSILWQRPLWPEGEVLFYNTVQNKSSDWGTSPWHWYGTSALPKAMLLTLFLIPLSFIKLPEFFILWGKRLADGGPLRLRHRHHFAGGINAIIDNSLTPFVLPVIAFKSLYSILPHKEVRFIFPALPMLNIAAAHGWSRLHEFAFPPPVVEGKDKDDVNPERSYVALVLYWLACIAVLFSLAASLLFTYVSTWNYPGGEALGLLEGHVNRLNQTVPLSVYVDVAAAMSGVSLFGQRSAALSSSSQPWSFDKGGYEKEHELDLDTEDGLGSKYTHMITEEGIVEGFHVVDVARGLPKISFRKMSVETTDVIYILEKDDFAGGGGLN